jgi:hypothetical protein
MCAIDNDLFDKGSLRVPLVPLFYKRKLGKELTLRRSRDWKLQFILPGLFEAHGKF